MGRDLPFRSSSPVGQDAEREKARADRIYGNDKLMPVVLSGLRHRREFDISKLRYDKVFIMADADVDGSHICTLMLTSLSAICALTEQGHVYKPLSRPV